MKKTKFNNLEIFLYYFLEKIAILSKDIVRIFFFFSFKSTTMQLFPSSFSKSVCQIVLGKEGTKGTKWMKISYCYSFVSRLQSSGIVVFVVFARNIKASVLSARNRGNVAKINICENNGASSIGTDRRASSSSIESLENSIKSPFNPTFEQSFDRRQFLFFFFSFPFFFHFSSTSPCVVTRSFDSHVVHFRSTLWTEEDKDEFPFNWSRMIVYFWKMERNSSNFILAFLNEIFCEYTRYQPYSCNINFFSSKFAIFFVPWKP